MVKRPLSPQECLRSLRNCAAVTSMLASWPLLAANPVVDRQGSTPISSVNREELETLPTRRTLNELLNICPARTIPTVVGQSQTSLRGASNVRLSCVQPPDPGLVEVYALHNQVRAQFGSPPLVWDPQLAAQATAYAPELARYGRPVHASRAGREHSRENLLQALRGTSPRNMVNVWVSERQNFVPGVFPDVSRTGNWADVGHYSQMVWPTTTNLGCAIYRSRPYDWLICRYSPPGNQDGAAIAPGENVPSHRRADWLCTGQGNTILCQNDPQGENGGEDGGDEANGATTAEAEDGGAEMQGQDPGETREREREEPVVASPEDPVKTEIGDCAVGVLAKVRIVTGEDDEGRVRLKETHNLAHGFSEVVIPFGFDASGEFKPSPDPTRPYPGTMTASWGIVGAPSPYTGTVTGNRAKLARGRWDDTEGDVTIDPGPNRPVVQEHRIAATWDPQPPTRPPECSTDHRFTVTFAGEIPLPDGFNTQTFVEQAAGAGFPGTRARERVTTGTRAFHEAQPRPFSRNTNIIVPIGIYWDLPENCCDIRNAKRKVIQFARAAIHGPNGRLGKGWGLDILPHEIDDAPNHDPTYTGRPGSDSSDRLTPGASGGTGSLGSDVVQWDAPGMPKDLFDRLHAAQGPSIYRQQFLSLLVCRPGSSHRVRHYLARAKVCEVAITTVRWDFPGQRGIRRAENYRQPTITVSFDMRDGNCADLRAFLAANGLLNAFQNPTGDARNLEILPPGRYQELDTSVTNWEANPFADVQFPR